MFNWNTFMNIIVTIGLFLFAGIFGLLIYACCKISAIAEYHDALEEMEEDEEYDF